MELDRDEYVPIVRMLYWRMNSQSPLPDGLTYLTDSPTPSPLIRVVGKVIQSVQSQTRVPFQTACAGTAALKPNTLLYEKIMIVASCRVLCVTPNVLF